VLHDKNYMTTGALTKGRKHEDDAAGKVVAPFPGEKAVMSIYGWPINHESQRKLKLTSRAVIAISPAALDTFAGLSPRSLSIRWITRTVSPRLRGLPS
jgi:hypothetical protein